MKRSLLLGIVVLLVVVAGAAAVPPVLVLPGNITLEATGASGAVASYTATATNSGGKSVAVSCSPASGSTFALGATTVTCTAVDETPVTGTFTVMVVDTTPPAIAGTVAGSAEAVGPGGSPAIFAVPTAVDAVDGPVPVTCSPISGSTFPVGTTAITCAATDTRGNRATSSGAIVVRDTVAPTVTVPTPIVLAATSAAGLASSDPRLSAFVASATATDIVTAKPAITTDAPAVFPVGTTTVRFTATDAAGNATSATSTVTVTPLQQSATGGATTTTPSSPSTIPPAGAPAAADRTPPGNVAGVKVRREPGVVSIVWRAPGDGDFSHVRILRAVAGDGGNAAQLVYEGAATRFRDTKLRNGTQYWYVIVSVDHSGNRSSGVAFAVRPEARLLWAPADGARVVRAPLLVWARVARATYYNVQLYRGTRKVLSAWSTTTRMQLPTSWQFGGKREKLAAGTYRWYVWPGFGARKEAKYGGVLGTSTFTVARP